MSMLLSSKLWFKMLFRLCWGRPRLWNWPRLSCFCWGERRAPVTIFSIKQEKWNKLSLVMRIIRTSYLIGLSWTSIDFENTSIYPNLTPNLIGSIWTSINFKFHPTSHQPIQATHYSVTRKVWTMFGHGSFGDPWGARWGKQGNLNNRGELVDLIEMERISLILNVHDRTS